MTGRLPGHVGRSLNVGVLLKLGQQAVFGCNIFQRDVNNEHRQQVGFACIKAALENMQLIDVFVFYAQGMRGQLAQCGFGVRRRYAIFVGFGRCIRCASNLNRQSGQWQFEF